MGGLIALVRLALLFGVPCFVALWVVVNSLSWAAERRQAVFHIAIAMTGAWMVLGAQSWLMMLAGFGVFVVAIF